MGNIISFRRKATNSELRATFERIDELMCEIPELSDIGFNGVILRNIINLVDEECTEFVQSRDNGIIIDKEYARAVTELSKEDVINILTELLHITCKHYSAKQEIGVEHSIYVALSKKTENVAGFNKVIEVSLVFIGDLYPNPLCEAVIFATIIYKLVTWFNMNSRDVREVFIMILYYAFTDYVVPISTFAKIKEKIDFSCPREWSHLL